MTRTSPPLLVSSELLASGLPLVLGGEASAAGHSLVGWLPALGIAAVLAWRFGTRLAEVGDRHSALTSYAPTER